MKKKSIIFLLLTFSILALSLTSINTPIAIEVDKNKEIETTSISSSGAPIIPWPTNGTLLCNYDIGQYGYKLCSDGSLGTIIAWIDERGDATNPEIYAQRINALGQPLWGDNGTIICNDINAQGGDASDPFEIDICSDENNGAIITWRDQREVGPGATGDIYAQRIDKNGKPLWTKNGTVICNSTGIQKYPTICSDEKGGAIITWQHFRTAGDYDIRAQYINSSGIKQWGAIDDYRGTVICNDRFGDQQYPQICSDMNGGAIITWRDHRNTVNLDIYAQRINSTGSTEWIDNGTAICTWNSNQGGNGLTEPNHNEIISDGNYGAIIAWTDYRDTDYGDIYAQKINSTGDTKWDNDGKVICNIDWYHEFPKLCSDGSEGAIITWQDNRDDGVHYDIYAQKINSIGGIEWPDNGTVICNIDDMSIDHKNPQICVGGQDGAIITWTDERDDPFGDIYAQLINSNGQTQWADNGSLICNYDGTVQDEQVSPEICSDEYGGAFIAWRDNRDDASGDIYAQKIVYPSKKYLGLISGDDDDDDDEGVIIPFGSYYLVFIAVGIFSVIIYTKRKLKSKK